MCCPLFCRELDGWLHHRLFPSRVQCGPQSRHLQQLLSRGRGGWRWWHQRRVSNRAYVSLLLFTCIPGVFGWYQWFLLPPVWVLPHGGELVHHPSPVFYSRWINHCQGGDESYGKPSHWTPQHVCLRCAQFLSRAQRGRLCERGLQPQQPQVCCKHFVLCTRSLLHSTKLRL